MVWRYMTTTSFVLIRSSLVMWVQILRFCSHRQERNLNGSFWNDSWLKERGLGLWLDFGFLLNKSRIRAGWSVKIWHLRRTLKALTFWPPLSAPCPNLSILGSKLIQAEDHGEGDHGNCWRLPGWSEVPNSKLLRHVFMKPQKKSQKKCGVQINI